MFQSDGRSFIEIGLFGFYLVLDLDRNNFFEGYQMEHRKWIFKILLWWFLTGRIKWQFKVENLFPIFQEESVCDG